MNGKCIWSLSPDSVVVVWNTFSLSPAQVLLIIIRCIDVIGIVKIHSSVFLESAV